LQDNTRLNGATNVRVSGNYAYVTSYRNDSFEVIDISTPASPSFAAQLTDTGSLELNGPW
jgi:hypothetical protein